MEKTAPDHAKAAARIADIFTDGAGMPLSWAKAILSVQARAFEAEDHLYASNPPGNYAGISEFGRLRHRVHADTLDAVHALIEVAEALASQGGK